VARDGFILLTSGEKEERLLPLSQVPMTCGGRVDFQVENALAAAAATWALGVPLDQVRAGLTTFLSDPAQCPGRWNLFRYNEATVVLDYAHNPSALEALVAALDTLPARHRAIVFAGFDREDLAVIEVGRILADGFDRVVLVDDKGFRDRTDGELNRLLRQGMEKGSRVTDIREAADETSAITDALDTLAAGDLLVLGGESIESSFALIQQRLAAAPQARSP
jgi:cyanophycin synthetase